MLFLIFHNSCHLIGRSGEIFGVWFIFFCIVLLYVNVYACLIAMMNDACIDLVFGKERLKKRERD